jgi:hypothetical protein
MLIPSILQEIIEVSLLLVFITLSRPGSRCYPMTGNDITLNNLTDSNIRKVICELKGNKSQIQYYVLCDFVINTEFRKWTFASSFS